MTLPCPVHLRPRCPSPQGGLWGTAPARPCPGTAGRVACSARRHGHCCPEGAGRKLSSCLPPASAKPYRRQRGRSREPLFQSCSARYLHAPRSFLTLAQSPRWALRPGHTSPGPGPQLPEKGREGRGGPGPRLTFSLLLGDHRRRLREGLAYLAIGSGVGGCWSAEEKRQEPEAATATRERRAARAGEREKGQSEQRERESSGHPAPQHSSTASVCLSVCDGEGKTQRV